MLSFNEISNLHKIFNDRKFVFLLSHMRSYTSLTGHIFGSHAEIEGYYEMHKGYFSWKSLYHAKLLYYSSHTIKKSATFLFDKILHNEHYMAPEVLNRADVKPLISIRNPKETIPSIVRHFNKVNSSHEFTDIDIATNYYITRLETLANLSHKIHKNYFYFDAETIKTDTLSLLNALSHYLELTIDLSPEYQKMERTGKRFSGDSSGELLSGKIQKAEKTITDGNILPADLLSKANQAYLNARTIIINNADKHKVIENTNA